MVDVHRISLVFSGGEFRFDCGERDWCEVSLVANESETKLGAAPLDYLVDHLSAFLEQPAAKLKWIMSLSERHYSAYGQSTSNGGVAVLVQDQDANTIAHVHVTNDERRTWLTSLKPFSEH